MPDHSDDTPGPDARYKRIYALDCYDEVRRKLAAGLTPGRVADYVQETCGEYTDVKRRSLEKELRRFRDDEIPEAEIVKQRLPATFDAIVDDLDDQVDVLGEYQQLIEVQKRRVEACLAQEAEAGAPIDRTGREIQLLASLLDQHAEFQQEFGLRDKNLGTLQLEASVTEAIEREFGEGLQSLREPAKRNQLAEFGQRLSEADEEVVDNFEAEVLDVEPADKGGGDAD